MTERDPAVVAFEKMVRRDAVLAKSERLWRRRRLSRQLTGRWLR